MPSKEKRKKKNEPLANSSKTALSIIQAILHPPSKVFRLLDFLKKHAPCLKFDESIQACKEGNEILNIVISPVGILDPAPHIKIPECREPVASIIDDVVWVLVQRRDRLKRLGLDGSNVLAEGYVSPSTQGQYAAPTSSQMRPGVTCSRPNEIVSLCKSSRILQQLHSYIGDELFRTILLHTRLFLPVESDFQKPRGNFILLCGPPLPNEISGAPTLTGSSTASVDSNTQEMACLTSRPKKKRRRFVYEVDPRMKANTTISRYSLFYSDSFIPKVGLPRSHPLNRAATSEELLSAMASLYNDKGKKRRKRWKRLRLEGIDICRGVLRGHSNCDYPRLLHRHCPLPAFAQKKRLHTSNETSESPTISEVSVAHTPPERVVSFVGAVLRRVFPGAFWGSERNFSRVMESVKMFVALRKEEKLPNKCLMYGIRIQKLAWLHGQRKGPLPRTDHEAASILTLKVFRWLFRGFIIPLLRSNFYVTETQFSGKQVLYYRKPVWSLFRYLSMKNLLKKQFVELTLSEARKRMMSQSMGFSQLRLVPKATGFRPIAHLSRRPKFGVTEEHMDSEQGHKAPAKRAMLNENENAQGCRPNKRPKYSHSKKPSSALSVTTKTPRVASTNSVLAEVFDVIRYESGQQFQPYGVGLDSLVDFYPRYYGFIKELKRHCTRGKPFDLHFASVDIEKCYDTINQEYLWDLTKGLLSYDDYFIQHFGVSYSNHIKGGLTKRSKKVVGPLELYRPILQHGSNSIVDQCNGVILNSRKCTVARKKRVLALLEEHLHSNVVVMSGRFNQRILLQSSGISQGSILSMILCNLYYGNLETRILDGTNDPQSSNLNGKSSFQKASFLARLVDDFLFIGTSKMSMKNFLQKMYEGKPELGAQINREKTIVSTSVGLQLKTEGGDVTTIEIPCSTQQDNNQKTLFPWCGMLFDTETGEVSIDYTRFFGGKIRDSLTVDRDGTEGRMLRFRMEGFVRPRCMPILFDSFINSRKMVVTNFYQMILFAAAKTAEYLRSSSMFTSPSSNIRFFLGCVDAVATFSVQQIMSNMQKHRPKALRARLILDSEMASWLCWQGFHDVFIHLHDFSHLFEQIRMKLPTAHPRIGLQNTIKTAFNQFQLHQMITLQEKSSAL